MLPCSELNFRLNIFLYYKSQKIEHDEDLRRIKEYLLQNNDEEFVTQKLLPMLR
jgi:hypothetical protein